MAKHYGVNKEISKTKLRGVKMMANLQTMLETIFGGSRMDTFDKTFHI